MDRGVSRDRLSESSSLESRDNRVPTSTFSPRSFVARRHDELVPVRCAVCGVARQTRAGASTVSPCCCCGASRSFLFRSCWQSHGVPRLRRVPPRAARVRSMLWCWSSGRDRLRGCSVWATAALACRRPMLGQFAAAPRARYRPVRRSTTGWSRCGCVRAPL